MEGGDFVRSFLFFHVASMGESSQIITNFAWLIKAFVL